MASDEPDELWSMRNSYFVGNYDGTMDEASSARLDEHDKAAITQREYFIQRATLAKGEPIKGGTSLELKALKSLSNLISSHKQPEEELALLKKMVEEDGTGNEGLRVTAGIAFFRFGDYNEALRILKSAKASLEALHVTCSVYISIDRNDLAKKTLEQMQAVDEDATLTQLASAWVSLTSGTETGVRDAAYLLEELIGKWQATPLLVGGLSCALIQQGKYAEGEKIIQSCAGSTADLTVNRIVIAQHEGRRLDDYIQELKKLAPVHAWFQEMSKQSEAFDRAAATFKKKKMELTTEIEECSQDKELEHITFLSFEKELRLLSCQLDDHSLLLEFPHEYPKKPPKIFTNAANLIPPIFNKTSVKSLKEVLLYVSQCLSQTSTPEGSTGSGLSDLWTSQVFQSSPSSIVKGNPFNALKLSFLINSSLSRSPPTPSALLPSSSSSKQPLISRLRRCCGAMFTANQMVVFTAPFLLSNSRGVKKGQSGESKIAVLFIPLQKDPVALSFAYKMTCDRDDTLFTNEIVKHFANRWVKEKDLVSLAWLYSKVTSSQRTNLFSLGHVNLVKRYADYLHASGEYIQRIELEKQLSENAFDRRFENRNVLGLRCVVCRKMITLRKETLVSFCAQCHHGGHVPHLAGWFKVQSTCPFPVSSFSPSYVFTLRAINPWFSVQECQCECC